MRQLMLPILPVGTTDINEKVTVDCEGDNWIYYLSTLPIYTHSATNKTLFRLHTAQLIQSGLCRPVEIISTFGVSKSSVMRALKQYREKGTESFFESRVTRTGGTILKKDVLTQAQNLLDEAYNPSDVAAQCGVKADTLRKAIKDGRLKKRSET
jgi:hypothetical protein